MNTADILALYDSAHTEQDWSQVFKAMAGLRYGTTLAPVERTVLSQAQQAIARPDFTISLGYNPQTVIEQGRNLADRIAHRLRANQATYHTGAVCWKCGGTQYVRHGKVSECKVCRAKERRAK